MLPVWAIWLILCGAFLIAEIFTISFLMFWPGVGAFLAFIANILGFSLPVQIGVFTISTALMIIFMKPLLKKFIKTEDVPMNSNAMVGKQAIVIKEINNLESKGQVKVNGELWSAISENNEIIPENSTVEITGIDGVKLRVKTADSI